MECGDKGMYNDMHACRDVQKNLYTRIRLGGIFDECSLALTSPFTISRRV